MSLIHALKWSFFSELASKAISPIVFIVLARLLTPEDFGVMSAALMVMGFSQIFWEAGMGKALIQRQTNTQEAANVAFWVNIGLSALIGALLFTNAGLIARTFFQDDRVTAVIQVMTLQVFLGAVSSVHTALLQKDMGFKKLFWVRFATVSLPGLASIPLALNGMGYWALVAGTLVGQLVQVIMLWRTSRWRPALNFDTQIAKEMGGFGAWVGTSGLLAWFYVWADSLIVGMYLGSHDLGLYRIGNQLIVLIYSILFSPIFPVLYSRFSKNSEILKIRKELKNVISIIALISIPLSFLLFGLSSYLETFIFSDKWIGVSEIIAIMALSHGVSNIFSANGEAYRAAGYPAMETLPMFIGLFIFIPIYLYSINHGITFFLISRLCAVSLFGTLIHSFLCYKVLKIKPVFFLKYVFIFSSLGILLIEKQKSSDLIILLLSIFCTITSFFVIFKIDKLMLKSIYSSIKN